MTRRIRRVSKKTSCQFKFNNIVGGTSAQLMTNMYNCSGKLVGLFKVNLQLYLELSKCTSSTSISVVQFIHSECKWADLRFLSEHAN